MIALWMLPLAAAVTPVQKVLTMMRDMKTKGEADMSNEATMHSEYMTWCKETTNTKEDAIREAGAVIDKLKAQIQKADADAARLTDEIKTLDASIAKMTSDKQASTELRAKEEADYKAVHTDYSESLDAMAGALRTLSRVAGNQANPSFVQSTFAGLPAKARMVLTAFLEGQDGQPSGAPAGNAYSSSVGSVIDMVQELEGKLSEERAALEKDEANAKHAYQMLQQELTMAIEASTEERDTKAQRKAARVSSSASDSGDLSETQATRDEDDKYLAELTALCQQKASDFDARQTLRGEELEALQKAIDIIASGAVSGAADTHLPALVQSFALLRASTHALVEHEVASRLHAKAKLLHSKNLALVATKIEQGGHFDKITQMIKDMIKKLTEEAAEEADHKAWCDGELKTNKQTRDAKNEAIDELMALSEELSASIAKLGEEIAELSAQIAELDKNVAEATAQRQKEKAANTKAVADAKVAIVAVKQAIGVLKEFYAKAATATSLVQASGPADDAPASFDEPYRGMGGSSTGVMGMLDVILSDFVRLEEETTSEEASQQREFDAFSTESQKDRDAKAASMDMKSKTKTKQEVALNTAQEDLKRTQEELDSAEKYHQELKTNCIEADVSYEERVAGREEEIASLKEALEALSTE